MVLKFKRSYASYPAKDLSFIVDGTVKVRKYHGKDYLIIGNTKNMREKDYKVMETLFGKEVVYCNTVVLVPRSFFFI